MPKIDGQESKTIVRDIDLLRQLKQGKLPQTVIAYACDKYKLSSNYAETVVYTLNAELKRGMEEFKSEAAEYVMHTLINEIEECSDDKDRKNKLRAIELLAKTCKVWEEQPQVNINNYGFEFGGEQGND